MTCTCVCHTMTLPHPLKCGQCGQWVRPPEQCPDGWLCPRCLKLHPHEPERCDSCEALGYVPAEEEIDPWVQDELDRMD